MDILFFRLKRFPTEFHSRTNMTIRENNPKMHEAFSAISGLVKHDLETMNMVFSASQKLIKNTL